MEPFRGILNIVMTVAVWLVVILLTSGVAIVALVAWGYLVFAGAEKRREVAAGRVQQTLMPGENLIASAVQLRPFALWSRRKSLGITDSRIIVIARGLVGGFTMRDIQWKDLQDAELSENVLPEICGSALSFAFRKHDFGSASNRQRGTGLSASGLPSLIVGGVPCEEARAIYCHAQAQEQAWEEKRRIRAIEETRAAAGGVYVNTGPTPAAGAAKEEAHSLIEQISSLKQLLDTGAISDAEFNEMKSKIIARA
jgi:hypothetical protein